MRKLILYIDARNEYRWKIIASNGKTVASSSEGYKNKSYAKQKLLAHKKPGDVFIDRT